MACVLRCLMFLAVFLQVVTTSRQSDQLDITDDTYLDEIPEVLKAQKPQREGPYGSLAELNFTSEKTPDCSEPWEETGRQIGSGANGKVMEVRRKLEASKYALKEALDQYGAQDIAKEVKILKAAQGCPNVMPLIDDMPCVRGRFKLTGKKLNYAYVSTKMAGDLDGWLRGASRGLRDKCARSAESQLREGLTCLHEAGYIHGDFKPDNVLYEGTDSDGCPTGLRLADFGLSHPVNSIQSAYSSKYYPGSWHLVEGMFEIHADTLKIKVPGRIGQFYASPAIDFCGLYFMMRNDFGEASTPHGQVRPGACGPMGHGRRMAVP
eukprot:TRINITY_DN46424_c0_g1_i1.p1 TRINITY_DN46424_c0_g1~~TRINITY_DN46424_c0_g1_i1.p1  ORF type:complete len:341 (-),score=30.47 TRINITY_DN46424_c0_g1_i1:39-1004(-)